MKEHSDSKSKYTEEDIIKMLEFLVDTTSISNDRGSYTKTMSPTPKTLEHLERYCNTFPTSSVVMHPSRMLKCTIENARYPSIRR